MQYFYLWNKTVVVVSIHLRVNTETKN